MDTTTEEKPCTPLSPHGAARRATDVVTVGRNEMDSIFAEILTNAIEKIGLALRDYKGKRRIDIRICYQDDVGEWVPTRKSNALSVVRNGRGCWQEMARDGWINTKTG